MSAFAGPLSAVNPNVNAPNFAENFSLAASNISIIVPVGVEQVGAFAFDLQENNDVLLDNDIPDHYLEDNTAAQDHIAVKPDIVTLSGWVVELNLPNGGLKTIIGALTTATNGLSQLPIFLGTQTPGAVQALQAAISQAQSVVIQVEQAVARAAQLANLLIGLVSGQQLNRQQAAYLQLRSLRDAGIIFTVYSQFQTHYNMTIESLRFVQPPDSQGWSRVVVRMKKMNVIGDAGAPNYEANLSSPVASAQGQAPTQNGPTAGSAPGAGVTTSSALAVP